MRKTLLQIILLASAIAANAQIAKYDLNGDGKVNVADVTDLVNYILTHSNDSYKSCPDSNHPHWIDLGLPSGTQWRCCNEGASTPEGYGGYYEFGQVASAPSLDQIKELLKHTTAEWTTQNGVNGRKFTGSNGGTIFLPAAGYRWGGEFYFIGSGGYYWSSTPDGEDDADALSFFSGGVAWYSASRSGGPSVRPTKNFNASEADVNNDGVVDKNDVEALSYTILSAKIKEEQACPDSNHPHWIDLGLPSGTQWRCCNEGASTPEGYGGYYEFGQVASAPSLDQIKELLNHTTSEWTTQNGVNGRKFTGRNGGTIFLPAAGLRWGGAFSDVGSFGLYWSSTPSSEYNAYELRLYSSNANPSGNYRDNGQSVRPVR